jgi:D-alanyl-D-alanine carboxypeptidase/D-alanyl-D-alanine-endopeptidase (penicillin-binding protein 4)
MTLLAATACRTSEQVMEPEKQYEKQSPLATMLDTSKVFSGNITGFMLYDPETDSVIYSQYADKYFTPASNTKLFTFYAGLKILPDRLRGLDYVVCGDSLIFWGTGDPSFLHPDFATKEIYRFLEGRSENLYYADAHFKDKLQGPGWAWGDYNYYYSAERSPLPVYGNVARFEIENIAIRQVAKDENGEAKVSPEYFRTYLKKEREREEGDPLLFREIAGNTITYKPRRDTSTFEVDKPFHYNPELVVDLLSDTLDKSVTYIDVERPDTVQSLYNIRTDTLFKRMLQPSDNLIAEQLMLNASLELEKRMNVREVIDYMKEEYLDDLSDEPQWVDGSGLSRYNMFTPRSIIELLGKIDAEFEDDRKLFELLPAGGESGTISNLYSSRDDDGPYVFAKTGTLSNNHSLSGYLITRSGRKLYFTFQNNHYISSTSVVQEEMEKMLWYIHQNY